MSTPTASPRVLIVEDEAHLARTMKLNFELEGAAVGLAPSGRVARLELERARWDVIILDVQLPDTNGFELCRKLRDDGDFTPVIMLTVRSSPADRVEGLEAGADDYLAKPFAFAELFARVQAQLRRQRWTRDAAPAGPVIRFGQAVVDLATHDVTVGGEPRALTSLELELVAYFARHPNRVISRDELLAAVWKLPGHPHTRTIDNFVGRLRKHFEPDPTQPVHFLSLRGSGYRFVPEP
ncbi:MAG: response regulator transcription factor [Myxococcota bacterium]